jgi:hypothetical protein
VALVCGTCATVIILAGAPATAPAAAPTGTLNPATYSFLTQVTDELGVPGYRAGSELTPTGGVYTGDGEVDWRIGTALSPLPVLGQRLLGSGAPIESLGPLSRGGVSYRLTVLAAATADRPVAFIRVAMINRGPRPASAEWGSVLSYAGGAAPSTFGLAFRFAPQVAENSSWRYVRRGREMLRSGRVLEIVPAGGRGAGAMVRFLRRLAPGGRWELDFAVPTVALAAGSPAVPAVSAVRFGAVLADQERSWQRLFAGAMRISLPERKVSDSFDASLALMAESRYPSGAGWVQTPNKLQYNAFYLRDASFIARAFDVAGLHTLAQQDLDYFPNVQDSDGLFISQADELDGLGEALWAIGQHAQWPGAGPWAEKMLPSVSAGVAWLARACASDPDGLVPVSTVDDNERTSGHITGDDFLAADGLQAAVGLARVAGAPRLAAEWQRQLGTFELHLHRALGRAERRTGGWIPPDLEDNGGLTWGNLWASYPSPVTLSPDARAVSATLAHVTATFRQGIATYDGMLHDYLGFRVFETELQRGDPVAVVNGLYAELAHTSATDGGFETDLDPTGSRSLSVDLAPHGWFAAEYVTLLRNMLVREDGGSAVQIMAAISPDWIQPGRVISVSDAPTTAGRVAYTLRSFRGGARLTWNVHLRPGVALRWRLPPASGQNRTLTLRGATGSVTVHWTLRGSVPSFTHTAAAILAGYGA